MGLSLVPSGNCTPGNESACTCASFCASSQILNPASLNSGFEWHSLHVSEPINSGINDAGFSDSTCPGVKKTSTTTSNSEVQNRRRMKLKESNAVLGRIVGCTKYPTDKRFPPRTVNLNGEEIKESEGGYPITSTEPFFRSG